MVETFGTLRARIQSDAKRPDAEYVTPVGNAIVSAIRFYEHLRMWFTQTRTTLTLLTGNDTVALPADFKALGSIKLINSYGSVYSEDNQGFVSTDLISLEEAQCINPKRSQRPSCYAIDNVTLYVNSLADDDYTLPLTYFRKDAAYPSAEGDSSIWFCDEAYELIRYRAMTIFFRDYLHDEEKAATYEGQAVIQLQRLEAENLKRKGRLKLVTEARYA